MPHGRLIKWCEEKGLTYRTVIQIKNNRLNFFAPNLVADILRALGYEVWQTKVQVTGNKKDKSKDKEAKKKETFYIVKKLPAAQSGPDQEAAGQGPPAS